MPVAEFESIDCVSSEDPLNPAKNLITSAIAGKVKKWLIQKKGEKQAYVIFKLKKKTNITNITIGNENTAIVEILVGSDDINEKEYKVLLPTTEIQTVQDTRAGRNKNSITFFTTKDFNKDVVGKQWNKIKVVCSQPYDTHIRYGLSCFVVKSINMDSVDVNDKDEESPKKERKELVNEKNKEEVKKWKEDVLKRLSKAGPSKPPEKKPEPEKRKTSDSEDSPSIIQNGANPLEKKQPAKKKKKEERKEKRPIQKAEFTKILNGVWFSMSGYQNPLRGDLRKKALEMGAKYSADWDSRCTHLVCAFLNTPKYNQAYGKGKIIIKDWIEECHNKRRRLPWRRFALDVNERQESESEEDVEEGSGSTSKDAKNTDRRRRLPSASSSDDTEDEIERIQARKKQKKEKDKKPDSSTKNPVTDDIYDADTDISNNDIEEKKRPDTSDVPLPELPNISTHKYFIAKDEKGEYRDQLERYVSAFGGKKEEIKPSPALSNVFGAHQFYLGDDLLDNIKKKIANCLDSFQWIICDELSSKVEYVITDDKKIAEQINSKFPNIQAVRSDWVWKCNDEDCLLPTDEYKV